MAKGTTINSDAYVVTLNKLKSRLKHCRPDLDMYNVLLQHDNARPYTSLKTRQEITRQGWTTLPYPPYNPDLAPSAVRSWLHSQPSSIYGAGMQALIKRWTAAADNGGDYVEK